MGAEQQASPAKEAEPAAERTEHAGVIYELLIAKGYLDEKKLKNSCL